jgi:uncharacterized membrane protein
MKRALRHLFTPAWVVRRAFPQRAIERIEAAIGASEKSHRGEIRFAVEGALEFLPVLRGLTPRERALDVFSLLKVWDTEENSGVLVYVQLVDRDIEIVADRGIARAVPQAQWDAICVRMQDAFAAGRFEDGAVAGLAEIGEVLAAHFPAREANPDELPDAPALL